MHRDEEMACGFARGAAPTKRNFCTLSLIPESFFPSVLLQHLVKLIQLCFEIANRNRLGCPGFRLQGINVHAFTPQALFEYHHHLFVGPRVASLTLDPSVVGVPTDAFSTLRNEVSAVHPQPMLALPTRKALAKTSAVCG